MSATKAGAAQPGFYRVGQRRFRIVPRAKASSRWPVDPYGGKGVPYRTYAEEDRTITTRNGWKMPVINVYGWLPPDYELGAACAAPRAVGVEMRARAKRLQAAREARRAC